MVQLDLNVAKEILEKLDGLALTNEKGQVIYANENWLNGVGRNIEGVLEKYMWDIIPGTRTKEVLETKKPILLHKMTCGPFPHDGFVSYYPIELEGKFYGVLIQPFDKWMSNAPDFLRKVTDLSRELTRVKAELKSVSTAQYSISNIIGISETIGKLRQEIIAAARTTSTVLIEGETGVGKELVAHSIHDLSVRGKKRFIRVNCSAIPENLMESEFFGYDDGAFTGAKRGGNPGKFELASGGSLFFDEISQLPLMMQPKFLRVLQEREIERIGGKDVTPVDVRVIVASNVPLSRMVQQGSFREDFYYRLSVVRIQVPPLRERIEDIPYLVRYLFIKLNQRLGMDIQYAEEEVYEMLENYQWPGNIRELENVLESAMNRAEGEVLTGKHIILPTGGAVQMTRPVGRVFSGETRDIPLADLKEDLIRKDLRKAIIYCKGNKTEAARFMGISRSALYKKIKKYDPS